MVYWVNADHRCRWRCRWMCTALLSRAKRSVCDNADMCRYLSHLFVRQYMVVALLVVSVTCILYIGTIFWKFQYRSALHKTLPLSGTMPKTATNQHNAVVTYASGPQQQQQQPPPLKASITKSLYYRRRDSKINEYHHRVVLGPVKQPVCAHDTWMLVLVLSHPAYVGKRQAIRQTWGQPIQSKQHDAWPFKPDCCRHLRLFFVLGLAPRYQSAVRAEQETHDDIIQGDFIDAYRNLTLKSLFGLKVVSEECPNVQYLLKSDDDMFINIPYLVKKLTKRPLVKSIMGRRVRKAKAWRTGKFALTQEQFPFRRLPPYIHGSSYVMSRDAAVLLYETSHYVPLVPLEDVYITGILARIARVDHAVHYSKGTAKTRQRTSAFAMISSSPATVCDIVANRVMTATQMTVQRMTTLWYQIKHQSRRC